MSARVGRVAMRGLRAARRDAHKQGVTNRQRPRTEQHPFESWDDLRELADRIGPRLGPLVLFAAATGLRQANGSHSNYATSTTSTRRLRPPRLPQRPNQTPKTDASLRAVPLQQVALEALDALPKRSGSALVFPAPARRVPRPAQLPLPRLEARPARARPRARDRPPGHPQRDRNSRPRPHDGREMDAQEGVTPGAQPENSAISRTNAEAL